MNSPAEQQQESLQDVLERNFDALEESGDEEVVETGEDHEEVEVSAEETAEATEATGQEEEQQEEVAAEEAHEELREEVQQAADSDYNEPAPERWPDEIKEVYNGLPPVARKAMLEGIYKPMQRSYTESTQNISQMKEALHPMMESMNQYRQDFDRMGVNPVEAFRTQMAWAAHLARVGPEQGLADMQNAYGLNAPTAGQQGQTQEAYLTPAERALKARLDQLEGNVQGQQQHMQQSQRQAEEQRQAAYKNEIQTNLNAFVNEKAEDGSLAHPHVNKVANGIAGVIRGGLVRTVDDYGQPLSMRDQIAQAYEHACRLDPSISTHSAGQRQVTKAQAAQKVDVVAKEPAGHVQVEDDSNIEDFISKTFDELSRRSA